MDDGARVEKPAGIFAPDAQQIRAVSAADVETGFFKQRCSAQSFLLTLTENHHLLKSRSVFFMGVFDINSKATKTDSLSFRDYWYLQYCLVTGLSMAETSPPKVLVTFKGICDAPIMKNKSFNVKRTDTVADLLKAIRKSLQLASTDSLYIFINQAFSPSLDHTVGTLKDCYAANDEKLFIYYSMTPAYG
ncbi:Ubiquitin-like protein ATG12 [Aphelenchoides bicaudatus]|nr:Ubiquitin-like protein ATG12 [Aphelenchoides bicaudatus]